MRVALLALCACNQVYDLSSTRVRDATEPDALPLTCPAPPAVPQFGHALTQAFADCRYFNVDATGTVAMATCGGMSWSGPPEGPLEPSGLPLNIVAPRPAPGGTRVYATGTSAFVAFEEFERSGDGWKLVGVLPFLGRWMSNVALDADGNEHLFIETTNGDVQEWERKGGAWAMSRSFTGIDIKTNTAIAPMVTSDGLRLIVRGQDEQQNYVMSYVTRERAGDAFGAGQRLADVPVSEADDSAYLTSDCTRIYVSGLQQVFYLRQQ